METCIKRLPNNVYRYENWQNGSIYGWARGKLRLKNWYHFLIFYCRYRLSAITRYLSLNKILLWLSKPFKWILLTFVNFSNHFLWTSKRFENFRLLNAWLPILQDEMIIDIQYRHIEDVILVWPLRENTGSWEWQLLIH